MANERKDAAIVLAQSRQVISAEDLLRTPVTLLDDDAATTAWSVLDLLSKKVIKDRLDTLRVALLGRARDIGKKGTSSSKMPKYTAKIGSATVTCTEIAGKVKIDETALKLLLTEKGIPEARVFKPRTVVELDEAAVEGLIAADFLTDEDVKRFTEVGASTERLTVKKSKEVLALIPKED